MCEELEYATLLNQAEKSNDGPMRMVNLIDIALTPFFVLKYFHYFQALVAAFAVSRYSSTESRVFRKPFNPIEGETYENVRSDLGWWYFAEQVSETFR